MLINIPGALPNRVPIEQELKVFRSKQVFEVGKVLNAIVTAKTGDNQLSLNINGKAVQAKTTHNFMPGEALKVIVDKRNNETILKVQSHQISQGVLTQAIRHVLPKQMLPTQLLNIASTLNTPAPNSAVNKIFPESIMTKLTQLTKQLPSLSNITGAYGLKTSINNSGVFLENKILSHVKTEPKSSDGSKPNLSNDFKTQLLKLLKDINYHLNIEKHSKNSLKNEANDLPLINQNTRLTYSSILSHNMPKLDQATKLLRAANLMRSTNFTASSPDAEKVNTDKFSHTKKSMLNLKKTDLYLDKSQTSQSSFIKQTSIPIKGAIPQPINNQNMHERLTGHTLKNLQQTVTGALSRIQANQLSSLVKDPVNMPSFLLELPINITKSQTEVIPFLIEEEAQKSTTDENKKNWSMTLALDLENLGPIQIKVNYSNDKINVTFWSKLAQTQSLLEDQELKLKEALKEEAINIGLFSSFLGLKENNIDIENIKLLDIKS